MRANEFVEPRRLRRVGSCCQRSPSAPAIHILSEIGRKLQDRLDELTDDSDFAEWFKVAESNADVFSGRIVVSILRVMISRIQDADRGQWER